MSMSDIWNALLNAKKADQPCEACGHTIWAVSQHNAFLPLVDDRNQFIPEVGIRCVVRACAQCGNVRLHQVDMAKPSNN